MVRRDVAARMLAMTVTLGSGTGPLRGLKVVELAGIGPGPHAAMLLADLGADVIRIERPGGATNAGGQATDLLTRGRPSVAMNLRDPRAVETVLSLVADAEVFLEGMRPGTAERLGLGPEDCHQRNPRLVYGRMTGWGQHGPLSHTAGHDMNYLAISGTLHGLGQTASRPQFPSNLLGDFGGGSTYLVVGVLAALLEARAGGRGQVVDAAVVDGAAHLGSLLAGMIAGGAWREERAANLLDGGMPFYDIYETADHKHMAVGALEPQFYAALLEGLGLSGATPDRDDAERHSALRDMLAKRFAQKSQEEWTRIFEDTDACVSPVLPVTEAARHPHLLARETYVEHAGVQQPAPAPRFSRTPATLSTGPTVAGGESREALTAWGVLDVEELIDTGVVIQA